MIVMMCIEILPCSLRFPEIKRLSPHFDPDCTSLINIQKTIENHHFL